MSEELVERARAADILEVATRLGAELKRHGTEHVGHCPAGCTTHGDGFAINVRKKVFTCRPSGAGGDAIALLSHAKGLDFKAAVAWLTGEEMAKAPPAPRPRAREADADQDAYREKEIAKAKSIWERGTPIVRDCPADLYLSERGLYTLPERSAAVLRFAPSLPYWHARKGKDAEAIHTGPAMLAAVTDGAGELVGCHVTYLNPDLSGQKLALWNPDAPDELLPAKKLRGSKRKAAIRLVDVKDPRRIVIGEGIETVLSVYAAEAAVMKASWTSYWSAIDLGHLAGKAAGMVDHPTKTNEKGKPLRVGNHVPAPQPDRDLELPDGVTQVVLLGDGDSDRFITEMHLRRAAARFGAKVGCSVKVAWAPEGLDFNDLLKGAA